MKKKIEHFNLDENISPLLVKSLKDDNLDVFCSDIRENLIKNCSINGGHLASNLGVVELSVALHKSFDFPKDKVIFDVGHQCYVHKILSGRNLCNLRHKDGVSGFQKMEESEFDPYEAGHSSTSISAAMGLALTRDLDKEDYHVIAVIGDSSFANGVSFEAINNLGTFNHKVIIIINDNEQAIGKTRGLMTNYFEKMRISKRYRRIKNFFKKIFSFKITKPIYLLLSGIKNFFKYRLIKNSIFSKLGIYYISNIDGHDIKDLCKAFKYAKDAPRSVIIHVTTTKGKGYSYAEQDKEGHWHGVEPFDVSTGKSKIIRDTNYISWSDIYSNFLKKEMENNEKLILINPGTTVGSKMDNIFSEFPNRCFDVGISEEHAAIFASSIAVGGYKPYYSVYSTFLQRAYDEISHDVARMNLDVTLLIDRCGMPNGDGETHQGIFDVAYLNSIPNFAIAMAKDYSEAKAIFDFSLSYDKPFAIRYPRGGLDVKEIKEEKLTLGKWKIEQNSGKTALISYGPVVNDLINRYQNVTLINAIFQRPFDLEVLEFLLKYENIIIYDIYGTKEGFADSVSIKLIELGYKGNIHKFAIPNTFIKHGTSKEQLESLSLDLNSLDKFIEGIN
jgi:1-deoxy-D-xylulose-5-phosphate synthase